MTRHRMFFQIGVFLVCCMMPVTVHASATSSIAGVASLVKQVSSLESAMGDSSGLDDDTKEEMTETLKDLAELKTSMSTITSVTAKLSALEDVQKKLTSLNKTLSAYNTLKSGLKGNLTSVLENLAAIKALSSLL